MTNHARYSIRGYYRVVLLHAGFSVVGFVLAHLGMLQYYALYERMKLPEYKVYWVTGYTIGALNVHLLLMSLVMYRNASKGIYTKRKKKFATTAGFCYGMWLGPSLLYGAVIVVYLMSLYGNQQSNYSIVTALLVLHCAWVPTTIFMIWYFYHVYLQCHIIPIGKNLETYEFGLPPINDCYCC